MSKLYLEQVVIVPQFRELVPGHKPPDTKPLDKNPPKPVRHEKAPSARYGGKINILTFLWF